MYGDVYFKDIYAQNRKIQFALYIFSITIGYKKDGYLCFIYPSYRGAWRNRTAVYGFADRLLTTRTRHLLFLRCKGNTTYLIMQRFIDDFYLFPIYFFVRDNLPASNNRIPSRMKCFSTTIYGQYPLSTIRPQQPR